MAKSTVKTCTRCGRQIEWRKKWERTWSQVKYCSDECRSQKQNLVDKKIEEWILKRLGEIDSNASICPSEAAQALFKANEWKENMERVRSAARRLYNNEKIEILQKGKKVDPSTAKGPIRLRLIPQKQMPLSPREVERIVEMAWEDRTSFENIQRQFGLTNNEVIKLMRKEMKPSSFKMWRKRTQNRKTKHEDKRETQQTRFRSKAQKPSGRNPKY